MSVGYSIAQPYSLSLEALRYGFRVQGFGLRVGCCLVCKSISCGFLGPGSLNPQTHRSVPGRFGLRVLILPLNYHSRTASGRFISPKNF